MSLISSSYEVKMKQNLLISNGTDAAQGGSSVPNKNPSNNQNSDSSQESASKAEVPKLEASKGSEVMKFPGQIAGHGEVKRKAKEGVVLKPLQTPPKTAREVGFYIGVQESEGKFDSHTCSKFIQNYLAEYCVLYIFTLKIKLPSL